MTISYAKQFPPTMRLGFALFLQEANRRHKGERFNLNDEIEKQREAKLNPLVTVHESYDIFLRSGFQQTAWKELSRAQKHVETYVGTDRLTAKHYFKLVSDIAEIGVE